MNTLWRTLYQHLQALRIWWYCKRDERLARRVVSLVALLEQGTNVAPGQPR